ncbi:hypothetical protein F4604DRAFT_1957883 [Suillus subluteus]|nr:hypothetical protein F4604DRAFT_1957883 [Suillus subluteus]
MASSSKRPGMAANKSVLTPVMILEGHEPFIITTIDGEHQDEIKWVLWISYFPTGKQMISGSGDGTIRRWDLREGKEIKEVREVCEEPIFAVRVSRDGRWIVTAVSCNGVLKVCEVETGIVRIFQDARWISCIKFDISTDSTLLAIGSLDGSAWIWSLDTGKLVTGPFKCSDGYADALRFSEDSRKLAVMSKRGKCLQVWDVQAQKLEVTRENSTDPECSWSPLPVFWTTKDKSIIAALSFTDDPCIRGHMSIYEFDASTLKTVGDPFKGHTSTIWSLALSSGYVLLASASLDNTIKLWSFESRQLLASFDVQHPYFLTFSPDSCQLAYTTLDEPKIYVCDIPVNILASIGLAKEIDEPESSRLAELLNSDATRHTVRRKPPISVVSPVRRPLTVTIDHPQPIFLGFLRKFLPSSRTDTVRPIRTNEPRNPLDLPATAPLPRPLANPHENFRPPTTQSSALASTSFKSRLHRLSPWWPLQTDYASTAITDVPLAHGKERMLHAETMNGSLMKIMFLLLLRLIRIRDSRPLQGRPIPECMEARGDEGEGDEIDGGNFVEHADDFEMDSEVEDEMDDEFQVGGDGFMQVLVNDWFLAINSSTVHYTHV